MLSRTTKERFENVQRISAPPAPAPAAVSFRFDSDPFLEKLAVGQSPAVGNLGLDLGLLGVEAEERRDRVDHVCKPQAGRHDVGCIILDGAVPNPALDLTNPAFDEIPEERLDRAACWAVGRCPEREERCSRGRRKELVVMELIRVSDTASLGIRANVMHQVAERGMSPTKRISGFWHGTSPSSTARLATAVGMRRKPWLDRGRARRGVLIGLEADAS